MRSIKKNSRSFIIARETGWWSGQENRFELNTTPSAPIKGGLRAYFLAGAATPPGQEGQSRCEFALSLRVACLVAVVLSTFAAGPDPSRLPSPSASPHSSSSRPCLWYGQGRQTPHGPDCRRLHAHRRQRSPNHQRLRVPEDRRHGSSSRRVTARSSSNSPQLFNRAITRITPVPEGDTRYQDRRLLALYFDMSALNPIDRFRALDLRSDLHREGNERPGSGRALHLFRRRVRVRRDFTDDQESLIESHSTAPLPDRHRRRGRHRYRLWSEQRRVQPLQYRSPALRRCRRPSICSACSGKRNR